ncbi:MAG: hypothetical protein N3A54_01010, partial [Patescibacteria group bacterium]|nr:hypothetical protein [Patescibacteria group bacterium]
MCIRDREIYLVENPFDAVRLGLENTVPILGKKIYRMEPLVKHCMENNVVVNVFLDYNTIKESIELYKELKENGVTVRVVNNVFERDIENLEDWELEYVKNCFIPVSEIDSIYISSIL